MPKLQKELATDHPEIPIEDQELIARLRQYSTSFRRIRQQFGLEQDTGLVSLPNLHSAYSAAMLDQVNWYPDGRLVYSNNQYYFPELETLPPSEKDRLILLPQSSCRQFYAVSIYQKKVGGKILSSSLEY